MNKKRIGRREERKNHRVSGTGNARAEGRKRKR